MGWFEEEFSKLKGKMKWGFRELDSKENLDAITPLASIKDTGKDLIIKFKIPGVTKKDTSVKVSSDSVELMAERERHIEVRKEGQYRSDKSHIKYYRDLSLPNMVDHEKAKIEFKEGLLKIKVPRIRRTIKFKLRKK